nr:hypothetical protein CKG001_18390 [Bdellovibrio sp. CKG001]BFD63096.1 hypothetical protein BdHM001_17770 [Bdellovibrio sp. HM001]BFD66975.1 hypothetical protein HAGR004_19970 [Bdellovibrio sp. HAGR004]
MCTPTPIRVTIIARSREVFLLAVFFMLSLNLRFVFEINGNYAKIFAALSRKTA